MFRKISIIIPALNEQTNIAQCIKSLIAAETQQEIEKEIIVADNGSIDDTVNIAINNGAKTIVKKGINIGALRNWGVDHSCGDLLAFVDADCIVSPDWLQSALNCLQRESAAAVGSHHVLPSEAGWLPKTSEIIKAHQIGTEATYIPSGNLIVSRKAFKAVGGFDESLTTSEDVDICNRLVKNGFKIFLDPSIIAFHLGYPEGIYQMIVREMWHGQNATKLFRGDLKKVVNLRVFLFSLINLLFLSAFIFSILLLPLQNISSTIIIVFSFLSFNLCAAITKCNHSPKDLPKVFIYVTIYGIARSLGLIKSFFK
jgi:glycosyltransferase involved in cell wall biosynthesis